MLSLLLHLGVQNIPDTITKQIEGQYRNHNKSTGDGRNVGGCVHQILTRSQNIAPRGSGCHHTQARKPSADSFKMAAAIFSVP